MILGRERAGCRVRAQVAAQAARALTSESLLTELRDDHVRTTAELKKTLSSLEADRERERTEATLAAADAQARIQQLERALQAARDRAAAETTSAADAMAVRVCACDRNPHIPPCVRCAPCDRKRGCRGREYGAKRLPSLRTPLGFPRANVRRPDGSAGVTCHAILRPTRGSWHRCATNWLRRILRASRQRRSSRRPCRLCNEVRGSHRSRARWLLILTGSGDVHVPRSLCGRPTCSPGGAGDWRRTRDGRRRRQRRCTSASQVGRCGKRRSVLASNAGPTASAGRAPGPPPVWSVAARSHRWHRRSPQ